MTIGCVILAGGKSSRMGTDKALLSIEDKNFINKLCDTFSFFEEKIIASGDREVPADITWSTISDVYPYHGPIGGLHAALTNCLSEAVFVTACDNPLIKRAILDRLLIEMTEDTDVVITVTEDGKYHPLCGIYRKSVGKIMEEQILSGNNRMMHVLKKVRVKYLEVNSEEYGLYNINTPEQYACYIKNKNQELSIDKNKNV